MQSQDCSAAAAALAASRALPLQPATVCRVSQAAAACARVQPCIAVAGAGWGEQPVLVSGVTRRVVPRTLPSTAVRTLCSRRPQLATP